MPYLSIKHIADFLSIECYNIMFPFNLIIQDWLFFIMYIVTRFVFVWTKEPCRIWVLTIIGIILIFNLLLFLLTV